MAIYFLPTYIAYKRNHRSSSVIFLVNFLFGLTIIGWWAALAWAISPKKEDTVIRIMPGDYGIYNSLGTPNNVKKNEFSFPDELNKLALLKDKRLITDQEFYAEKSKLYNK